MTARALSLVLLGALALPVSAATISVNFEGLDSNGAIPNLLNPADVAGVVPVANWNNLSGNAGTSGALNDDRGIATTATVNYTAQGAWSWERSGDIVPANPNGTMFNGYLDTTGNDGNHTLIVSGIPYATFDVYMYVDGEHNDDPFGGRPARFNAGGADAWILDNDNWFGTFTQGTGTDLASATEGANYVHFPGLTGSSVTLFGEAETFRAAINGFQIVEVPEPGTTTLAGFACLAVILRRRR